MLVDIAPSDKVGRISGWGWGTGYVGGVICMLVVLFFIKGGWITTEGSKDIRFSLVFVALWFLLFGIPLFIWGPNGKTKGKVSFKIAVIEGVLEIKNTFMHIRKYRQIFHFLIARLFYMDGLNTLFAFAGIFAVGSFGFSIGEVLIFGILSNICAGIGAFLMAWVDDLWGSKKTILVSLSFIFVLGAVLLFMNTSIWFWILGLSLSVFVGPAQASSRSYLVRIAPKGMESELFGIYSLSGRLTAFLAPILVGTVSTLFASQRLGMSVIFFFIAVGIILLFSVKEIKN